LICKEWPNIQRIRASLAQKDVTQANATRWPGFAKTLDELTDSTTSGLEGARENAHGSRERFG
jgi:hypothetical protein